MNTSPITSERLKRVLAVWEELRGDAECPARQSFAPDLILPEDLRFIALLDVHDEGRDFSYRLVGTGVVEAVGEEFTGVRIMDYIDMHEVPEMLEKYRLTVRDARPTVYRGSLKRLDREHIGYERLALPLVASDGRIDTILAAFEFDRIENIVFSPRTP